MTIEQDFEMNDLRLSIKVESKTIETHSRMQLLSHLDLQAIKYELRGGLRRICDDILYREGVKNGTR